MPTVMPYGADLDHTPEQVCFENKRNDNNICGSIVIQSTGKAEFEDRLMTGVLDIFSW